MGKDLRRNNKIKQLVETSLLVQKKKQKSESTRSLRDEMREELSIEETVTKREVPVMTRLDNEVIQLIDILVKLNIFKSRSEAVAAIVEKTLLPQLDKFDLLKKQITKLQDVQDTAKDIALEVLKG